MTVRIFVDKKEFAVIDEKTLSIDSVLDLLEKQKMKSRIFSIQKVPNADGKNEEWLISTDEESNPHSL